MQVRRAVVASVLLLASCASAPKLSYYTLDMRPSGSARSDANLAVQRFTVTERLDRSQIVIQASPVRVEYYATARWAAGLGGMVQQKLGGELGPADAEARVLTVSGRVTAFEQVDTDSGPQALVRLDVVIRDHGGDRSDVPLIEATYEASHALDGDGVEALVRALSRATEDVAVQIANDVEAIRESG
ncbi:MAG: ABC-type transport auxiliary lipoprotein family protein [Holophagae bacterium]|jgi:uncharacterized lipoprotein YmbA